VRGGLREVEWIELREVDLERGEGVGKRMIS
jgi:hypothetical protein